MDRWVESAGAEIARRAERELDALVGVSTPSGDNDAAEEALAICAALLPPQAAVERIPCSTPGYADDFLARMAGDGERSLLLVGHIDTVVPHVEHVALERSGERLVGPGSVDMKGGVVLAIGAMRALAEIPAAYSEAALLLVTDEEWRAHEFVHGEALDRIDACLCFEAGELTPEGHEGIVVKRKAAATLEVVARGVAAHSGVAPDLGTNALLAVADVAGRVASFHDPAGPQRLTAVPTVIRSGEAFNVVPARGELVCDLRAEHLAAFDPVLAALPASVDGATIEAGFVRSWPGMDAREATAGLLDEASRRLGRPIEGVERGGASDASNFAPLVPLTVDGLGPCGGGAHSPDEHVVEATLRTRAEVAIAVIAAALELDSPADGGG